MPPVSLEERIALKLEFEDGRAKGGNKGFTCKHCETRFFGSQTRQLAILLGNKGKGIAICNDIPGEDREALQEAYKGVQAGPGRGPGSDSWPESVTGVYHSDIARYFGGGAVGGTIHSNESCICRLC